ncbi:MAG: hypothetical protein OEO77_15530, partial [Acidimicrobiia bacterium]|nr:hypothetical protein [Acidimicrobiia bacterium]
LEIDTIRHGIEQARRDDVFVLVDEIGSSVLRNQGLGRRNSGGLGDVVGDVVVYGPELTNGTFETHFLSMAPERAQLVHNRHTVTDSEVKAVVVMLTVIRSAEFQDNQRLIGNLLAKGMRFLLDEGLVTSASGRGLSWTLSPAPGTTGRTPQGGLAMSERFRRQQVWLPVDDIGRVYVLPAAISTPGDVARLLDGLHAGLSGDDAPAQADVGWR